jgi:hypothetical protein
MDQQTGGAARLISGWNLGSGGKIQIGEQSSGLLSEMALIDAQFMSEDKRMEYLQDRIKRAEDQRVREGKARVDRKEAEGRIQRRADMWIDGQPTEMAYLIAQRPLPISLHTTTLIQTILPQ